MSVFDRTRLACSASAHRHSNRRPGPAWLRTSLAVAVVALAANAVAAEKPEKMKKPPIPKTEAECVARGGEWIFQGPQNVGKVCMLRTTDGGKSCKKSSQCQSECVEKDGGSVCAEWFDGCFAPTGRDTVTQCVN